MTRVSKHANLSSSPWMGTNLNNITAFQCALYKQSEILVSTPDGLWRVLGSFHTSHISRSQVDVPWGSAPGKTGMHALIMESSKDICSLFDSYLPNHEASTHEITWRMFSTQLRSSLKKNQIKRSSYVIVMLLTNQVIFSSREFRPPEKLEMANLLSDEPTVNSIMKNVIIHVLNVQESIGLDGFQKDSKTSLFGPNGETDKYWLREKMDFDQASKGHVLAHIRSIFFTFQSPGRGYMKG
ncbi:hypothetical protein F2Q68_00009287 [Brassica cretica]|uniref:Uncharacterized protein n=1 Tax=Brassica cretica TaxID=69181 RepID=A0A8S9KTT8_BRACR|nr:hypothetical protein F2Q68_00009287 [Brassica cretica]